MRSIALRQNASAEAASAAARAPVVVLRVVLAYAVFASLWILFSDTLVGWLVSDPARIVLVGTMKGWLFVVVTSLLLYALIRRLRDQALAGARQELAALAETTRALQLLAAIADNSSDAIFAKDREGRYLLANRSVERAVGKPVAQMLGQDDTALFPLQAETIRANDRRVMGENRTITYEESVVTVEGERFFLATKGPLHDEHGVVSGMFGISRDITESKRTEAAAKENIDRQTALMENLREALILADRHGLAIYWSPAALAMFGYANMDECPRQLAAYADTFEIRPLNEDRMLSVEYWPMSRVLRGEALHNWEVRLRRPDQGWEKILAYSGWPIQSASGERFVLISITDISDRRRAEAIHLEIEKLRINEQAAALEAQRRSELAALNLLEDAHTARLQAEAGAAALAERNEQLSRVNKVAVGRELTKIAFKQQVNALARELGRDITSAIPGRCRHDRGFDMKPQKAIGTLPARLHQLVQTEVRVWYPNKRRAKNSAVVEVWMAATILMNEARQMYSIATTPRRKDEGAR